MTVLNAMANTRDIGSEVKETSSGTGKAVPTPRIPVKTVLTPGGRELVAAFFILLAGSAAALFFACYQSPLYRYVPYQDADIYMAVARAMRNGLMPYRDVFDHKGILLYLVNLLAHIIFPKAATGVYIYLSVSMALFLFFLYRISRMFLENKPAMIAVFLVLGWIFGTEVYSDGGGSAEEYLLPCLSGCLYFFIRFIQYAEDKKTLSFRKFLIGSFLTGVFCGWMLWIKYTLIPAVGISFILLYTYLVIRKRVKDALLSLAGVVGGVLAVSIPCLAYLARHGILDDMWAVYIEFNRKYNSDKSVVSDINKEHLIASVLPVVCLLLGMLFLRYRAKVLPARVFAGVLIFFLTIFATILLVGRYYAYYFLVFTPFYIFATGALVFLIGLGLGRLKISLVSGKVSLPIMTLFIVTVLLLTVAASGGRMHNQTIFANKTKLELCADAINEHWASRGQSGSPEIISYLFGEKGLMDLSHTYPRHLYFYLPNALGEDGKMIALEQTRYVREGTVDYIFMCGDLSHTDWVERVNPDYRPLVIIEAKYVTETVYYFVFTNLDAEASANRT